MSRMSSSDVELVLTSAADAAPIRNLYPLHLHDIASYEHKPPNRHGVLSDGDDRTWEELLDRQAGWWERPGVLFPYVIKVGGVPAGFNLIASGPFVPTPEVDFVVYEFFVAHAWRGTGVAADAARLGIARHRGAWDVVTWPTAARAIGFWRKPLPSCASGELRESEEDHPWGRKVVFRFDNRIEPDAPRSPRVAQSTD